MRNELLVDLTDCTEFRQTLLARPPAIIHGTACLLIVFLGTAVAWSIATRADLVVRVPGRVRPVSAPIKVFVPARGEMLGVSFGSRVMAVRVHQGDQVKKGDVLVRLNTERLDNELAKRRRAIQAGEEELRQLAQQAALLDQQLAVARAKADDELGQVLEEVRLASERREVDMRLAESESKNAAYEAAQLRRLVPSGAAAPLELVKAEGRVREAHEKLAKARLPVNEGNVKVLRQARAQVDQEAALKRNELAIKRGSKESEVASAQRDSTNLELEREQAFVRAPLDGVVTSGEVKVGDSLEPGKQVTEIAEQKGFRFEAQVRSEDVGHLRIGLPARIKLDAYDYQQYGVLEGTVSFVAPDSGIKEGGQAAIYLVKIEFEQEEVGRGVCHGRVKLGMAGVAEIVTEQESLFMLLVKRIRRTISLG
jgi:HlyD family secretion protein